MFRVLGFSGFMAWDELQSTLPSSTMESKSNWGNFVRIVPFNSWPLLRTTLRTILSYKKDPYVHPYWSRGKGLGFN